MTNNGYDIYFSVHVVDRASMTVQGHVVRKLASTQAGDC